VVPSQFKEVIKHGGNNMADERWQQQYDASTHKKRGQKNEDEDEDEEDRESTDGPVRAGQGDHVAVEMPGQFKEVIKHGGNSKVNGRLLLQQQYAAMNHQGSNEEDEDLEDDDESSNKEIPRQEQRVKIRKQMLFNNRLLLV
jgi:hypothetical protein